MEEYRDALMTDLYLRENAKSRPSFARAPSYARQQAVRLLNGREENPPVLMEYRRWIPGRGPAVPSGGDEGRKPSPV